MCKSNAADPGNAESQRDLSFSRQKIADLENGPAET
jgi:hypothetical protein